MGETFQIYCDEKSAESGSGRKTILLGWMFIPQLHEMPGDDYIVQ